MSMEEIKEGRNDEEVKIERVEQLDILDIVNSIQPQLQAVGFLRVPGELPCTISQVPKALREVNKKCYEPQLVSIGPYHRGKEGLKAMEQKKFEHLLSILFRNPMLTLEDYVKEIKKLEAKATKCYSESISLGRKEFVEMMVLDGCFLVEIFLRIPTPEINDDLLLRLFINHDMLLLENQLPFFVLESILSLVVPNREADDLKHILLGCFRRFYRPLLNGGAAMKESYHHVLDMFRHHCLPTHYAEQLPFQIPSAEALHYAGIAFQRKEKMLGSFLDIEFHETVGVMKIPYLCFSDELHFIFRNLIAYEQCYREAGTFFTGYATFMDDLINTAKDVRILRHSGIIEHGLRSDEELAQLFNQLSEGIFIFDRKHFHLYKERTNINRYCTRRRIRWMAYWARTYFYSPWASWSFAGALLGLALTIAQTVIAVKSDFY